MLFTIKKRALIFDPEKGCMAISPEHLSSGRVDSEIPILAAFNGYHYQVWRIKWWNILRSWAYVW